MQKLPTEDQGAHAGGALAKFEAALALFGETALRESDGALAGRVFRFPEKLLVHSVGPIGATLTVTAERLVERAAEITGLGFAAVDSPRDANLNLFFYDPPAAPPVLEMACGSQFFESDATPLRAVVQVRTDLAHGLKREILRVLGHFGPASAVGSALGPGGPGDLDDFGELDRLALQALYRSGIATGLNHLPALEKARDFLAQMLGLVQPGGSAKDLARPYMDSQVALMRASTDRYIQMQLGIAYCFEHYVDKDPREAIRFWRLAAAQGEPEAIYRLAMAHMEAEGVPRDFAASRGLLAEASTIGHGRAALALGILWREGAGGPEEAVEAFAYFDLAHRRGVAAATSMRDQLAAGFDAATKARAIARAAELPTTPPRPAQ